MALIGTLRNKMTKWVVGFVGLAIVSFILSDLFGNSPTALFGGPDNVVGEIGGTSISIEEFQAAVREREANYQLNFGRQPGEREMETLRQQAWMMLISRHAIAPQYDQLGVEVTQDEIWDMIQGKNIDENIKVSFADSAGNFDHGRLMDYLKNVRSMPVGSPGRVQWDMYYQAMAPARERIKYENLLIKTNFVTTAESERQYHTDNDVAEIRYLYVPYYALRDSTVKASDAELNDYYNKNKEKYKTDEKRSIRYVRFPLTPSSEDTLAIRSDMEQVAKDFRATSEDSTFAAGHTEGSEPFANYNISNIPSYLNPETISEGLVLGPFLDGNSYKVVKVVDIGTDTAYQVRASHILFTWASTSDADKKEAKDKARGVLRELKAGGNFAAKAMEFNNDATKTKGGDLGWFGKGSMVPEFEKPVLAATKPGLLDDVVETSYGYHIIKVTEARNNQKFTIATIEQPLEASDETQDEAFRKADLFAASVSNLEEFLEKAVTDTVSVYDAPDLTSNTQSINGLGEARQIVTWAFREGEVGKVSTVFTLDEDYVVAVMTGETEKGYLELDEKLKQQISPVVLDQVRGKKIAEKLSGEGTLEDLAKAFPEATIGTANDVKLNSLTINQIGYDPVAVGRAFSIEGGKRTKPFLGESGVVIIESVNKTIAPAVGDYTIFKNQLQQTRDSRNSFDIAQALEEKAEIEDYRYKVY
jgi:peptidyl-prolyl cis-trans isomerase D